MAEKRVYFFGGGKADGNAKMKEFLGGKGANLAEMTRIGVPVPPGFTIGTKVCSEYYKSGGKWPTGLEAEVDENLAKLEKAMNAKLGDPNNPLLVSVRSGAAVSMPGMMDTVLNLGLNDDVIEGIIKKTRNPRFAYDIYRRLIDMFGDVVMGCDHEHFEEVIHAAKKKARVELDSELSAEELKDVVDKYKNVYKQHVGEMFPQDGKVQLRHAIDAVFGSWMIPRAIRYRELNNITGLLGTAVNVQAMVFGNMGDDCGTGVCFTRNPSTGEKEFYGEFLMNAQGEDVVAGIRTPMELKKLNKKLPKAYKQLTGLMSRLEKHYKDMQDMEFTIQNKVLYILQTRTGKRTAEAAVKTALDMVNEKLISKKMAVTRVEPEQLDRLLHPHFDPKAKRNVIARGLPASPGAAVGQVVFTADVAEEWRDKGKKVILVRKETSPEDIGGMDAAEGILTAFGGMTSHAAVVARGMGKCCVAGVSALNINYNTNKFTVGKLTVKQGDWISLDGSKGEIMTGQLATVEPAMSGDFGKFMTICDSVRKLGVRTNADTPGDAKRARDFGAEGIGLCRTEHMFFEGERIWPVRQIILAADDYALMLDKIAAAETVKEKKAIEKENAVAKKQFEGALKKLLPYQRSDFEGIFKAMAGLPVTIRLLDPPLHEFLPQDKWNQAEMALRLGIKPAVVKAKVDQLHEFNPMLGHRGCRLSITYPAIYRMQARAIIEAALKVKKAGKVVLPEIMIPLAGAVEELKLVKYEIIDEIKMVFKEKKAKIKYMIGTMIEVPRAALTADEIATEAEFFSFGTNDLTQMTMGFSRDDAGKFLGEYVKKGIYAADPFQQLDQIGVGKLVEMGTKLGRQTKKKLKIGICGEHGGDPNSIDFCHRVGMNYVSCSPFRVPIARLAAAQAAIRK
ncbi:MAG: pyruvate, phosphate dikinase [Planctomycetes bacterium]|nr:pyruvate, phosphate dikinase [Planctomycetota bacterium]MBL7145677.1 pyruvate, phosphate dikinase [Phycisphaerae bacterium]